MNQININQPQVSLPRINQCLTPKNSTCNIFVFLRYPLPLVSGPFREEPLALGTLLSNVVQGSLCLVLRPVGFFHRPEFLPDLFFYPNSFLFFYFFRASVKFMRTGLLPLPDSLIQPDANEILSFLPC